MPQTLTTTPEESISQLAARALGDAGRFREILAANPELGVDPFISPGSVLEVIEAPLRSELLVAEIEPALLSVREGVTSALQVTSSAIASVKNYAQVLDNAGLSNLSSEINGVFSPVENGLATAQDAVSRYASSEGAIQLVDWLLGE